jgi:hypothetical protein
VSSAVCYKCKVSTIPLSRPCWPYLAYCSPIASTQGPTILAPVPPDDAHVHSAPARHPAAPNTTPAPLNPTPLNPTFLVGFQPEAAVPEQLEPISHSALIPEPSLNSASPHSLDSSFAFGPTVFNPTVFNPTVFHPLVFNPPMFSHSVFDFEAQTEHEMEPFWNPWAESLDGVQHDFSKFGGPLHSHAQS